MVNFDFSQDNILAGLWDSRFFAKRPTSLDRTTTAYELELALENGGCSVIDGKKYPIRKYNFYCIKPGTVRHTEFPFKCLYIKFRTESESLKKQLSQIRDCFTLSSGERVHTLFNELLTLYNTNGSELLICSKFSELLYLIQNENAMSESRSATTVEQAKAYMSEQLAKKPTLQDIAQYIHFNPIYFHRVFKRETGKTPQEFLTELRIEKAKNDLCTTDSSISKIAEDCGFASPAYFGSSFKKYTGYTPLTFRKTQGYQYLADGLYSEEKKKTK